MTRTMTMTLKTVGAGRGAEMARTRAQGTQFVRRVVSYGILTSTLIAIAAQALAHFVAR
ncbi:hypothetical protein [Paraburkholderia sp. Ac-20347]|jgi:hypothetical protein|uniref:hypothetical protein n=1 Tax=Paraburkholderia sp. Ac-20347 TaxID=2703892 RepID=UPI001980D2DD|nr:hypothetical protein [Paraburkholderia sp. Ac-20347]MBN3813405.1 hypothetical protein [Paraburkholderia sp. Ac-20347]